MPTWSDYQCEDYLEAPEAQQGYWDEPGQVWIIEPLDKVEERPGEAFLQVGRPGVDDIGFGYRAHQQGFWALKRMPWVEYQYLAPTMGEFLKGWLAGTISL